MTIFDVGMIMPKTYYPSTALMMQANLKSGGRVGLDIRTRLTTKQLRYVHTARLTDESRRYLAAVGEADWIAESDRALRPNLPRDVKRPQSE